MKTSYNVSLRSHNTFAVEVKAKKYIYVEAEEDIFHVYEEGLFEDESLLFLGGGSNLLFVSDFNGTVVHVGIKGIESEEQGDRVLVSAGAGVIWNDLVNYCVENGYGGVENLALIPGTAGAAPVQNIGAYGVELLDTFFSCRVFDIVRGTFRTFYKEDCAFGYRDSVFKHKGEGRYLITKVNLLLSKTSKIHTTYGAIEQELKQRAITDPTIEDIADVVKTIRMSKLPDPDKIGNAGSFFKNPIISVEKLELLLSNFVDIVYYPYEEKQVKLAAGWLIEQCGWKGKQIGKVSTWPKQALVVVNTGNASGVDIYDFSEQIITSVEKKFGVRLEREVNVIGQLKRN